MITNKQINIIIVMIGLGYTQQEIADALYISRKTVENWLTTLKSKSLTDGIYNVYSEYINPVDMLLNQLREEIKEELKTEVKN